MGGKKKKKKKSLLESEKIVVFKDGYSLGEPLIELIWESFGVAWESRDRRTWAFTVLSNDAHGAEPPQILGLRWSWAAACCSSSPNPQKKRGGRRFSGRERWKKGKKYQ